MFMSAKGTHCEDSSGRENFGICVVSCFLRLDLYYFPVQAGRTYSRSAGEAEDADAKSLDQISPAMMCVPSLKRSSENFLHAAETSA